MSNYRRDNRTEEQFKKDIKECHQIENVLMNMYVDNLNSRKKNNIPYSFIDNGIDNTGKFIPDSETVTCDADFLLVREGQNPRPIEIKFSRKYINQFHFKINQMKYYIKNNICVVNFNNIDGDTIEYCIFTPKDLEYWLENGNQVIFWKKQCIRFKHEDFKWYQI